MMLISRYSTLIILSIVLTINAFGQKGETVYSAEARVRSVNHEDYKDIKGSPYLFEDWFEAKVIGMDGKYTEYLYMNFNGLTHQLELMENGNTQVLIENTYLKAILSVGENEYTFMSGIHPDLGRDKICILFDGQEIKLIKDFTVRIDESVAQTPGVPTVFERFATTVTYYMMKRGLLVKIKLKKKTILRLLDDNPNIEEYSKKEKISFNSESDVIKLLKYYESSLSN
ncbi:MAG: hypothetical protein ABFS32_04785 [Bacteroidota bacterium]